MSSPRPDRRGFVLPFVILALAAAAVISLAFADEALRATVAVRAAVAGADAAAHAEAGFAVALAQWDRDSLWTTAPGSPVRSTRSAVGVPVTVEWQRHQPLVATLRVTRSPASRRRREAVLRDHLRSVWLDPPRLPVPGALTSNGAVVGGEGTIVSGSDLALPRSPCGVGRDTASVPAVVAARVDEHTAGGWPGAPPAQPPPPMLQRDLRAALFVIAQRSPAVTWDTSPRPLPVADGWQVLRIRTPHAIVAGPAHWRGLLVVHGDLTVRGAVQVEGLLVVEGTLDASTASLTVQGSVVVTDTSASSVMLGTRSRLFFDRCAVQMALATVARPRLAPFSIWQNLPH